MSCSTVRQSACLALLVVAPVTLRGQVVAPAPVAQATAPAPGAPAARISGDSLRAAGATRETHDPLLRSGVRSARSQITAIATTEDKKAKGQIGIDRQASWGTIQLRAAASTPLAENVKPTTRTIVADLSDLPGVNTGEFGGTLTYWRLPTLADRNGAAKTYEAAVAKVRDHLQQRIDNLERARPSAKARADENAAHAMKQGQIDAALRKVDSSIAAQTVILNDHAVPAARDAAQRALSAALAVRDGLLVARDGEQKRHEKALADITSRHAAAEIGLNREIAELKEKQKPFQLDQSGKIAVVGDANPAALMNSQYRNLVEEELETIDRLTSSGPPILVGMSGTTGRKKYEYLDSTTLAAVSQTLGVQQIRVAAGILAPFGFLSGYYAAQRSVKEMDQFELCRPLSEQDGVLRCTNARLGAPTTSKKNLVGLEYRGPLGPSLMLGLEVSRDVTGKLTSWEVPFYFMPNKPGGTLNGGIIVGGQSDENGFMVKAFVGAAAPPILR